MKLGVIIVTYNRVELLKECVTACLNQTYPFNEILVVNNASTDNTKMYLKSLISEKIKIINMEENVGGAGGFYEGVKYFVNKDIDYILFIDDDAIISNNYNEVINEYIKKDMNKNIIAYSGTVYTNNQIVFEHRKFLKSGFKQVNSTKKNYQKDFFDYELSTFCGLYLSKSIIEKIGLPRKDFFIWSDDIEYCLRFRKYGKIRNINSIILNHKTKIDLVNGYSWKSYYGLRNTYIILKEYFNFINRFVFIFNSFIHIIGGKILDFIKKNEYYVQVSTLYRDALHDAIEYKLGKNVKYTNKFKLNK